MKRKGIIVVGCGKLGASIATLRSTKGEDVLIIDPDSNSFRRLSENYSGYEIIGDGTDLKTLENAGIKHTRQMIITTDNDCTNILIAHIAHFIYKVPSIFVRLEDVEKAKLFENTSVKVIYPFILSLNEFTRMESEEE